MTPQCVLLLINPKVFKDTIMKIQGLTQIYVSNKCVNFEHNRTIITSDLGPTLLGAFSMDHLIYRFENSTSGLVVKIRNGRLKLVFRR